MAVSAIMTPRNRLFVCKPDDSLAVLREVFVNSRFQHVPVVDESNRLLGIVSVKDYFKVLNPVIDAAQEATVGLFIRSRRVEQIMVNPVITCHSQTSIKQAATLLVEHNIGCLPVADTSRHLLGLVSWKDIMKAALRPPAKS